MKWYEALPATLAAGLRATVLGMLDGLSFTVLEPPNPMDDPDTIAAYDARQQFSVARRVWLGANAGTDWLHEAVEAEFGEDAVWYDVLSQRNATHIGASAEWSQVVLILMGVGALDFARKVYGGFAQRLGEMGAESMVEWARRKSRERRAAKGLEQTDGPPDLTNGWGGPAEVAEVMRQELADIAAVAGDRLELVECEARAELSTYAKFRDSQTGTVYVVEARRDDATFTRLSPGDG